MTLVIVERQFEQAVDIAAVQAAEDAAGWCLEAHQVRFVRSYFAADRRRMVCVYDAPDAEAVRTVQRQAGLPFTQIWAAQFFDPQ